jgi:hypothetical protein
MSRAEVNARGSTVTLHVVSSLDGVIAKKDNSVSWLDSSGDFYEKGVSEGNVGDAVTHQRLRTRDSKSCSLRGAQLN